MAGEKKIHVNKKTGKSGPCGAKIKCPLGEDTPHFNTQEEADKYIQEMEAENNETFPTVKKAKSKQSKAEARNARRAKKHEVVAGRALTRTLPEKIDSSTPLNDMIHLAEYKGEQVNVNIQEADGSIHLSKGGDDEEEVLHMRTMADDYDLAGLHSKAEETLYDGSRKRAILHGDNGEMMEVQLKPGAGSGGAIMEVTSFTPAPQRPKAKQAQIDELRSEVEMGELRLDSLNRRVEENSDRSQEMNARFDSLSEEEQEKPDNIREIEDFYDEHIVPDIRERDEVEDMLEYSTGRLRGMLGR